VEVDAAGQVGEGAGVGSGAAGEELLDLIAAGELEQACELAVDRMLHDDVQHGAALVHHGVELGLHIGAVMTAGHLAQKAGGGRLDDIAPGGSGDLRTGGPEQGHVAHDHLTADAELLGQRPGADGLRSLLEKIQDRLPALVCLHEEPSLVGQGL